MGRVLAAALVTLIALLFLAVALPDSSLARWLVDVVRGGERKQITSSEANSPADLPDRLVLRAAIGAMISPQRTIQEYEQLYRFVARKLHMSPEIVQRRRYAEVNLLLESGEVDFAWACTGAVGELQSRGVAEALVTPVVGGTTRYRAYLIARKDSGIASLEQLRGRRFAFTDPLSLTGRAVVVRRLSEMGETPESYFSRTFFTFAHDNSVRAVQRSLADGATVDSHVFDLLAERYPEEVSEVHVIWQSDSFPNPPIVVSTKRSRRSVDRLRDAFLSLHEDAEGRAILERVGIERFVLADPAEYSQR